MPKTTPPFAEEAQEVRDLSVRQFEPPQSGMPFQYTLMIASVADKITPWGRDVVLRDGELRQFYPTEDMLASAVSSIVMRNQAFDWKIEGPERTSKAVTQMLNNALAGTTQGWMPFIASLTADLSSQDNGAFIEVIRAEDRIDAAVVGIGHLDAGRCTRTRDPFYPVIYRDLKGNLKKLKFYQVIALSDFPSPIETMNGVGLCAVSRVLRMAQIYREMGVYKNEKVSGRFARAIHVVGGVSRKDIEDIQGEEEEKADNKGLTRFMLPMILTSLDPEKPVSHVEIPLASLPEDYDADTEMKWYLTTLALGFNVDYQDFAPLPGGNLGTSTQSEVLHRKSRGKGPAWFQNTIRDIFRQWGVVPKNSRFVFYEQDIGADVERAKVAEIRARTRALQIKSGEINQAMAREIAVRNDDFEKDDLRLLEEADVLHPGEVLSDGNDVGKNVGKPGSGGSDDLRNKRRISL